MCIRDRQKAKFIYGVLEKPFRNYYAKASKMNGMVGTCLLYTSGSGKGALEYWVAVVKPGRVLFEIAGVPEETAREALRLAMHKLPCKCKIVSKADLEGGDNSEN